MARGFRLPAGDLALALVLALPFVALGCSSGPAVGAPAGSSRSSSGELPGELPGEAPTEATLRSTGAALAEREGCEDTCCTGFLPIWLLGVNPHAPDTRHAEALRAIIDRSRDARVRALALRRLAQALDLRDVDRMAALVDTVDASEPAGRFPGVTFSQQVTQCSPVQWTALTLGQVSLAALEGVTGETFPDARALHAWRKANPDPLRSMATWERVLGRASPVSPELLSRLREVDAKLHALVLLTAPGAGAYGAGEAEIVQAARVVLGPARLLALLAREEVPPELVNDDARFARLARSVLVRAEAIFAPSHAPALLRLWQEGALRRTFARAALAKAASRFHPAERCSILAAALTELPYGQAEILEELAGRCAAGEAALLEAWFYGPSARPADAAELAVAILKGLRGAGPAALPALKALVKPAMPLAKDPAATEALVEAALAAGCPDAFPRRGGIRPPGLKNLYAGPDGERRRIADEAEAAATRRDCVSRALAWLSSR